MYLVKQGEFECTKTISRKKDEKGEQIMGVYGLDKV